MFYFYYFADIPPEVTQVLNDATDTITKAYNYAEALAYDFLALSFFIAILRYLFKSMAD